MSLSDIWGLFEEKEKETLTLSHYTVNCYVLSLFKYFNSISIPFSNIHILVILTILIFNTIL